MDLYSALSSGVNEKSLTEMFERQLAEARMKLQAERTKEENKDKERRAAAKALVRYLTLILGEDVPAEAEEIFCGAFKTIERELERDMKREKTPTPINGDAEILKAFLKTL